MGRQRKLLQLKGMEDSPLKEVNEMEASKLSNIEFKIMVIRMLKELTDNYKELSEKYNSMKKEIETINKNQEEMKNIISFFFKDFIYLFLERGERREKERERNINVWLPHGPPTGDLAHNPGMCPDWELNQSPFGLQFTLNPLSHTRQGRIQFLK